MPKIKIKNLSAEINRRIKLIKTATSVVDIGQQQGAVVNQSDYVGICLAPSSDILGCEGAVDHITVGTITDGGIINVYLNDQWLNAENVFFFRNGGASDLLRQAGIQVTPLTSTGLPATDSGEGHYYDAERARLVNTTTDYKRIRIELLDANSVDDNFTPENGSFEFNPETNITTFCLSPKSSQISCEGATQIASFRMSFPQIDNWSLLYNDPLNFLGFADMYINDQNAGPNIGSDWAEFGIDVIVIGLWNGSPPTGTQEWLNGAQVEFRANSPTERRVKFQSIFVENFDSVSNPTISEVGFKSYGFCLAAKSTEFTCTPETASQSVELFKSRDSLPFLTFANVAFNIYENGALIGSELSLISISDMQLVGLEVLFMDETNRRITISNRREAHRPLQLEPTMAIVDDVDIINGDVVTEGGSFFLCLAGSCEPTEFVMSDNNLFEGGSVRLDYVIDAPDHGISNVSKRFSMTDIAQGTYLSEIVRDVIAQIKEDHSFIAFREGTGNAVANFDYWTYRSTTDGLFRLSGITGVISKDPITIKFVKNNLNDDLFPLIFPGAASDGITEYSAHSCGTQDLPGI